MAAEAEEPDRRDFIILSGVAFAGVGALSLVWPFVDQMNPDAGALALASTEVDLSPVPEGQAITVMWRGKPVFIRNRTAEEIEAAKAVPLTDLPDEDARNLSDPAGTPATDENRTKAGKD